MDVLNVALIVLNSVLLTLVFVGARVARKESELVLSEAKKHEENAATVVNTAHESVTGMAEQVVSLTKRFDDLKNTIELMRLRIK